LELLLFAKSFSIHSQLCILHSCIMSFRGIAFLLATTSFTVTDAFRLKKHKSADKGVAYAVEREEILQAGEEERFQEGEEDADLVNDAADKFCNICRTPQRSLANPNQKFKMNNKVWTCGKLQTSVGDLSLSNPDEARWCKMNQYWAEKECKCKGPRIPPLDSIVKDPNPACNMCPRGVHDFDYVPGIQTDQLVNTGKWGRHSCSGWYKALAKGIVSKTSCAQARAKAGPFCCNLPKVDTRR